MKKPKYLTTSLLWVVVMSTSIAEDRTTRLVKELKSKTFDLKTYKLALLGNYDFKKNKLLTEITLVGDEVRVNGRMHWKSYYLPTFKRYSIKEAKVVTGAVELNIVALQEGKEYILRFFGIPDFETMFRALFFKESDGKDLKQAYATEVSKEILESKLESYSGHRSLQEQDRSTLLRDLIRLSDGVPAINVSDGRLTWNAELLATSDWTYNTQRVTKNQMVSTTLDLAMKEAKLQKPPESSLITMYHFYWTARTRDFAGGIIPEHTSISLTTDPQYFSEFKKRDLSVLELVQKSRLEVENVKYSLTNFDPLASQ